MSALQPGIADEATEVVEAAPTKGPVCGCLNRLRVDLRAVNGTPGIWAPTGAAIVFVRRRDANGPIPPTLLATFCPFCGEEYA